MFIKCYLIKKHTFKIKNIDSHLTYFYYLNTKNIRKLKNWSKKSSCDALALIAIGNN